jgi:hypothetical protein
VESQQTVAMQADFIRVVLRELPPVVYEILITLRERVWVAGGAVRDALANTGPARDIDLWFADSAAFEKAVEMILQTPGYSKRHETAFAATFDNGIDPPIQLIHDFYSGPEACIKQFDFSVNQAAVWIGEDGQLRGVMTAEFDEDILPRRLRYVRPPQPMPRRELYRMTQLLSRGYSIEEPEVDHVLAPLVTHITEIPAEVVEIKLAKTRRYSGYRGRRLAA